MHSTPDTHNPPAPEDPRQRQDFAPQYYPKANGQDAPAVDAMDRNEVLVREFLTAYYDLNCAYARLLDIRLAPASPQRQEAERDVLRAVERLLIARDGVEDRSAPFGIIAEPVVRDGFTVDVKFSYGNMDAAGQHRSDGYTITAVAPVPLPEGFQFDEMPVRLAGPGINPE